MDNQFCSWIFDPIIISVKNGQNLEDFLKVLTNRVVKQFSVNAPAPLSRLRHREALERTNFALQRSLNTGAAELMAEDLRIAARELGKITGRVDVEDVLDVIFHEFCIGKWGYFVSRETFLAKFSLTEILRAFK